MEKGVMSNLHLAFGFAFLERNSSVIRISLNVSLRCQSPGIPVQHEAQDVRQRGRVRIIDLVIDVEATVQQGFQDVQRALFNGPNDIGKHSRRSTAQ